MKKDITWSVKGEQKKISELTPKQLRFAYLKVQTQLYSFHQRGLLMDEIAEEMRVEAERKAIDLTPLEDKTKNAHVKEFFYNEQLFKKKYNVDK